MEVSEAGIKAKISTLQGQVKVAAWFIGLGSVIFMALAGAWGHSLRGAVMLVATENKQRIEKYEERVSENGKRLERYDASIREQNRRLDRIESDVKEIKQGQDELIRKLDRIFLNRERERN